MPKTTLSDMGLRSLVPTAGRQLTYWDASFKHGLFGCRVSPGGTKTFLIKHRNQRITIGRFPTISLSEARTEAKRLLAEFTLGKVRPQSLTYSSAVQLFLEDKQNNARSSTVDSYKGLLTRLNFQGQLADISVEEIRRKLNNRTNYNHYLVALKVFFNWCIKRHYITHNPTIGFSKEQSTSRARVLTDAELKSIWRACEQRGGEWKAGSADTACGGRSKGQNAATPSLPKSFATIVKLLILTGQRRNEIASLQSSWIKKDEKKSNELHKTLQSDLKMSCENSQSPDLWQITFPKEVTKNGREHTIPIGSLSLAYLSSASASGDQSSSLYIFAARTRIADKPFSGWSKSKAALDKLSGVSDWTLHDLRRTFRTIHAKIGTPPHIAERLVNHVSAQTEMERVYDQYKYLPEMRSAMDNYERYILDLLR